MFYLLIYAALLIGQILSAFAAPNAHNKAGKPERTITISTAPALVVVNQNVYESPKAVETVTVHDNKAGKPISTITVSTTSTVGAVEEVVHSTSTQKDIPTTVSVITFTTTAPALVVVNQNVYDARSPSPSPKAVETVTVHDVRPSPRAVSQVTVTVQDVPAPAPSPKTITKVEEPAVNSALPPTVAKTVIKSTRTPVNFTEDFKTWYMWEHIGFKGKRDVRTLVENKGWRVPTGFPTSKPEIGERLKKREVEDVDIITSYTTLTFTVAPIPAPTPAQQQQQQQQQPPPQAPQLLPGQIPTTRSDLDGIAVVQGDSYPDNLDAGVHQFVWDADHPERVEIGGEYANLVSTLVKYTPPPPQPTPQPQPAPQPAQQQEEQPRAITFTLPGKTEHVVMTLKTTITTARTLVSVFPVTLSVSDAADASPSVSTSLLTIPAGQIGNQEATVVSVLVPAAATPVQLAPVAPPASASPASAPPASAPPASVPPASTPPASTPVAPSASAPEANTPVAPAANTPAADTPDAATTPAAATTIRKSPVEQGPSLDSSVSEEGPQEESPKAQEQENKVDWETVVAGQEVVVDGQTVEVVAVITGGPGAA